MDRMPVQIFSIKIFGNRSVGRTSFCRRMEFRCVVTSLVRGFYRIEDDIIEFRFILVGKLQSPMQPAALSPVDDEKGLAGQQEQPTA